MNSRTQAQLGAVLMGALCAVVSAAPVEKTLNAPVPASDRKIDVSLLSTPSEKRMATPSGQFTVTATRGFARQDKRTIVIVGCTAVNDAVLKKFNLHDSQVTGVYPDYNVVTVAVGSQEDLRAIAAIPEVAHIRPAFKGVPNVGLAMNQAYQAMRVDTVRDTRRLDGASQKVGILSDSFAYGAPVRTDVTEPPPNTSGILRQAAPQESGDLPGEVELLADDANLYWDEYTPTDEGEAMAELIYDLAPGARLAFHTAEPDFVRMAQGILALKNAGCTIITDDYSYLDEPWFMDGPVSSAIASVVKSGVCYFSAAGNSADSGVRMAYKDFNPRQSETEFPPSGVDFADWGSGYGPYLPITFNSPESSVTLMLQWNQPWETFAPRTGGSQVDLDLYLLFDPLPPDRTSFFASMAEQGSPGSPSGDPIEWMTISYSGSEPFTLYLAVDSYGGPRKNIPQNRRAPVEFWLQAFRADEGNVGFPLRGPTTSGHQTAAGTSCVGAVPYWESPVFDPVSNGPTTLIDPEWFTSRGGNIQVPFDSRGAYRPRTIAVPNLTAVDGCDTLFFGDEVDDTSYPNFFGTSAAAPNAAGAAALLRQADAKLKPADVQKIMGKTAVDVQGARAAAGFDTVTGSGLIDANAAVKQIRKGENLAIVPVETMIPMPAVTVGNGDPIGAEFYTPVVLTNSLDYYGMETPLAADAPVYAWFAVANTGTAEAGKASLVKILVDGAVVNTLTVPKMVGPSVYNFEGVELPPMAAGTHTVEVRLDTTNRIRELNENDNVYRRTVEVTDVDYGLRAQ
jgi:hypothetical protein